MNGGSDARPTTRSPGAGSPDGGRPSGRELAASRRADAEPTLADAGDEMRQVLGAVRLMGEWGVTTIEDAIITARDRVRGARRRAGYDR